MTGPIIPAELWPEDAHLHTWDSNGLGNWLRPSYGAWHLWATDIPLPPCHDWRVPVMRPTVEESSAVAPTIDLEQFRRFIHACGYGAGASPERTAEADRLLALIDGQKAAPRGPDQPDLCDLCRVRDEVRTDADGIPFCQECWDGWQASEQPTEGEGEKS